jgi:hypothetical protein
MSYQLSAISYQLSAISYQLSAISYGYGTGPAGTVCYTGPRKARQTAMAETPRPDSSHRRLIADS